MSPDHDTNPTRSTVSRQITDAMVRLYRENAGRGPVSARAMIDSGTVVVLLHEVLTRAEQTLVDHGNTEVVLMMRRALQDALRPAFVVEVERITGRRVSTFMSTSSADPDRSAEIFLLEN